MNYQLLLLTAAGFFLLAPVTQHQIYGVETSSSVIQNKVQSDEEINLAVKNAISSNKEIAQFVNNINITVDKGVVTLSGVVNSSKAKSDIEAKAKTVVGVKKVVNNIEVKA